MLDFKFPDLQQYPANGRGRGECKDGALQTLTTNSNSIYSEETSYDQTLQDVSIYALTLNAGVVC